MNRHQRLPSLRRQLIGICVGSIFFAMLASVLVLVLLISNVMGNFVNRQAEFTMQTVSENLYDKTVLLEDILLRIGKSSDLQSALSVEDSMFRQNDVASVFASLVDIYSNKNIVQPGQPFVEMVYFYDLQGEVFYSTYYELLYDRQQATDNGFRKLYEAFQAQSKDVMLVPTMGYINIIYTVYDQWTDSIGTVIFAVNQAAVEYLMESTSDYEGAFWYVLDHEGAVLGQNGKVELTSEERLFLSSRNTAAAIHKSLGEKPYLLYTKELGMGLCCAVGVPMGQMSRLMFQGVAPYVALCIVLLLIVGGFLFIFIFRLTKPLPEVADKMEQVANQKFDVKLPNYRSREFSAVSTTFNSMTDTIHHLINDVYEKKLVAMDNEIRFLQSQVNPHFMYNVLCSIAMTAQLEGNPSIQKMASSFAALTQARLSQGSDIKVTLAQELQYISFYMDLQNVRFGDKIKLQTVIAEEHLLQCLIPKLTVEMIVENAVAHGLEPKEGSGTVTITIDLEDARTLRIVVRDDGVGFPNQKGIISLPLPAKEGQPGRHNRIAINNVSKLMEHLYGKEYGLSIVSYPSEGTTVTIRLPKEESHHV